MLKKVIFSILFYLNLQPTEDRGYAFGIVGLANVSIQRNSLKNRSLRKNILSWPICTWTTGQKPEFENSN